MTGRPEIALFTGQTVPRLGFGCWAIGGPYWMDAMPRGWGEVDDAESVRAIHRALELGIRFFDSADVYGAGHSERVLGGALKGRDGVFIATKVGNSFDEARKQVIGSNADPGYIRTACDASLRRLGRDVIDLYQLHIGVLTLEEAEPVRQVFEDLVAEGKIRGYGWSTDDPARSAGWLGHPNFRAIQHDMNIMNPAVESVRLAEANGLISINRSPLAMGFLSGKFKPGHAFDPADIRGSSTPWLKPFKNGRLNPEYVAKLEAVHALLTAGGRTAAQGALGWIWTTSEASLPIPGFRTVEQAEENAGALDIGPLPADTVAEINLVLGNGA